MTITSSRRLQKAIQAFGALLAVLAFLSSPGIASHHFESQLAKQYPEYDLTDLYVFDAEAAPRTVFIMDVNPTTKSDGKPALGNNGVYSFHVASNRELTGKGLTITAHIEGNEIVVGIVDRANPAVGSLGTEVGRARIGSEATLQNGIRVWTGAARDPFVGNSDGIIKFNQEFDNSKLDLAAFDQGQDLFRTFYTTAIVMEVPNALLPPQIAVFATSAMYNVDKWDQVNRLAHPLMTHLFMHNNPMEVSEHVGHRPDRDNTRKYALSANVLKAVVLDSRIKDPVAYADKVANLLLPDLLTYRVGSKAAYTFDSVNGRRPSDDAMDVALSLYVGRAVTDRANTFDRHPKSFPYVVPVTAEVK